jgi:hypothetical protein
MISLQAVKIPIMILTEKFVFFEIFSLYSSLSGNFAPENRSPEFVRLTPLKKNQNLCNIAYKRVMLENN